MVVGYATPGKEKALVLLQAFCAVAGGKVVDHAPAKLLPGAAAFYGVTAATRHLWVQARKEGRDWYYIDNAYFDPCRQVYFRVTKNRLQHRGTGPSDGSRFAALNINIAPWRAAGAHVVICPQSDEFMKCCAEYPGSWLDDALRQLRAATKRELRVRPWDRNKKGWYATLPRDLEGAHALVTYSSAAATSALMAGIPAFCTAEDCVTAPAAARDLSSIEAPRLDTDRLAMAVVAADHQFTLAEMRSGLAWRTVNA